MAPSTLSDPPLKSLALPGECQFTEEFTPVPLLKKYSVSPTSFVLRFGLPDEKKPLGLSTCACVLAGIKADDGDGMVVRPYTPISTNAMIGSFDLLVKAYPEGKMSSYLASLEPSSAETSVSFKHIPFNVKIQHPFGSPKFVGMIAGGTGIAPMIQALHAILGENKKDTSPKVALLYGSRNSDDILGKDLLDTWSLSHEETLLVTHILSHEPDGSSSTAERGFISGELIQKSFPGPEAGSDVKIFVCGPPPMYEAICGSKKEDGISGILGELGYSADQVFKF